MLNDGSLKKPSMSKGTSPSVEADLIDPATWQAVTDQAIALGRLGRKSHREPSREIDVGGMCFKSSWMRRDWWVAKDGDAYQCMVDVTVETILNGLDLTVNLPWVTETRAPSEVTVTELKWEHVHLLLVTKELGKVNIPWEHYRFNGFAKEGREFVVKWTVEAPGGVIYPADWQIGHDDADGTIHWFYSRGAYSHGTSGDPYICRLQEKLLHPLFAGRAYRDFQSEQETILGATGYTVGSNGMYDNDGNLMEEDTPPRIVDDSLHPGKIA